MEKTLTAINFLREQKTRRAKEELKQIIDIIKMNNERATDDMFTLGAMDENDLMIDIDEKFMLVDGWDLVEWIKENCDTKLESDKSITVTGLKLFDQ